MTQRNPDIFIEPIKTNISDFDTRNVAQDIQSLLWDDFSRLHNADLDDLRTLCNPDDEEMIDRQTRRLYHPAQDAQYYGIYEPGDPDMTGMAKIAPWTSEYEKAFVSPTLTALKSVLKLNKKAVGLDAFALSTTEDKRPMLTQVALEAIYFDDKIVPRDAELKAVVDINDDELTASLDKLGATAHEKIATIRLQEWTRSYTLRTLPAKQTFARPSW